MHVSFNFSRNECIQAIGKVEIEQITRTIIKNFAIQYINGISLDNISQQEYEEMGGRGKKLPPLSDDLKFEIYLKIKRIITPIILQLIAILVKSVLNETLEIFSDEELRCKASGLIVKKFVIEIDWKNLTALFEDNAYLFKELEATSNLKANLKSFHDRVCPFIDRLCVSEKIISAIYLSELLSRNS